MTDMRAKLTVSADASSLIGELKKSQTALQEVGSQATKMAGDVGTGGAQAARGAKALGDEAAAAGQKMDSAAAHAEKLKQQLAAQADAQKALAESAEAAARLQEQFVAAQRDLEKAMQAGNISAEEGADVLAQLTDHYERASAAAADLADPMNDLGQSGDDIVDMFSQVMDHVSDFIASADLAGQAATRLTQTLTRSLVTFGMGALTGAVSAGIGALSGLAVSYLTGANRARELEEQQRSLEGASRRLAQTLTTIRADDLAETYGRLAASIQGVEAAMLSLDREAHVAQVRGQFAGYVDKLTELSRYQQTMVVIGGESEEANQRRSNYYGQGSALAHQEFLDRVNQINSEFDVGNVEGALERINDLVKDMRDTRGLDDLSIGLREFLNGLRELAGEQAQIEAQFNGSAETAARFREHSEMVAAAWQDINRQHREANAASAEYELMLTRQLDLAEAALRYGADSVEVQALKNDHIRDELDERMRLAGISEAERDRLLEIYDNTVAVTQQTADWADRMAAVADQVRGVAAAIASLAGGMVSNAARATELQALRAGASAADAARAGARVRAEAEFDAREAGAGSAVERWVIRRERDLWEVGQRQEQELAAARLEANQRDRPGRGGAGRRKGGRSGGGARGGRQSADREAREYQRLTDQIDREIGRLQPSYDRDVAAAQKWRDETLAGLDAQREGYAQYAADVETIYQERLAKAYQDDLQRRDDWAAGVERAFKKIEDATMTWANLSEELATSMSRAGETAFLEFSRTGMAAIDDLLDHVQEQFLRAIYQMYLQPYLNNVIGSMLGAAGGVMGVGAPAVTVPTAHTGGAGVMRTYSAGNRPRRDERLAMLRDGEQVMTPRMLENGAAIIDALSAAAGSGGTVVQPPAIYVNVENKSGQPVSGDYQETTDARGQRQIRFVMDEAVAGAMVQPGGRTQRAAASRFGLKPRGPVR